MIEIKWRQDRDFTTREPLPKPVWHEFDLSDINHMSRTHAINLFRNSTPVVIKQGDICIVNTPELLKQYRKNGRHVMEISELVQDDGRLDQVGIV